MSYFVFFCLLLICKRGTTHFGEVFMKMIQQTAIAKSATKSDGDF